MNCCWLEAGAHAAAKQTGLQALAPRQGDGEIINTEFCIYVQLFFPKDP